MKENSGILNFFSKQWLGWLIFTFCIVVKSILIFYYSYVGRDKIYHLAASGNLLNGKGWTTSGFAIDNINTEILQPFCNWPPGYGLIITPFNWIFGNNIYLSTTILEICFFIFFLFISRLILKLLDIPLAFRNIYTLLIGFFPYDFIEDSLGTDLPSLCFLLAFFYFLIKLWKKEKPANKQIITGVAAGLCLFLAGLIRYTYVPVGLIVPAILLAVSYLLKKKSAIPALWACFLCCTAGLVLMMVFLIASCGSPLVMVDSEKGIFLSNLYYSHPAILASFINIRVAPTFLQQMFQVSYSRWLMLFSQVNLVLYAVLFLLAARFFFLFWKRLSDSYIFFKSSGILLSLLILIELAYLSLTNALKPSLNGNVWTYIAEGRYHAFILLFIQFLVMAEFSRNVLSQERWGFKKAVLSMVILLLFFSSLHQVYFAIKVASNYNSMKSAVEREADYKWFEQRLGNHDYSVSGTPALVASTDAYYPLFATIYNQKGIIDPYTLDLRLPVVNTRSTLWTVIHEKELEKFSNYLSRKDVVLVIKIGENYFYIQTLIPK